MEWSKNGVNRNLEDQAGIVGWDHQEMKIELRRSLDLEAPEVQDALVTFRELYLDIT